MVRIDEAGHHNLAARSISAASPAWMFGPTQDLLALDQHIRLRKPVSFAFDPSSSRNRRE
jgi:hypothetical protein